MVDKVKSNSNINEAVSLNENTSIIIVANKYVIDKKIGKGSFGEVYKGYDIETKE